MLERRLDNAVYKLGLANNHNEARQFVRHGHYLLNGKKVNIPSQAVRPGDVITVIESSRKNAHIMSAIANVEKRQVPQWLELDAKEFQRHGQGLPCCVKTSRCRCKSNT